MRIAAFSDLHHEWFRKGEVLPPRGYPGDGNPRFGRDLVVEV